VGLTWGMPYTLPDVKANTQKGGEYPEFTARVWKVHKICLLCLQNCLQYVHFMLALM
jgi:hypothetical protein